MESYDYGSAEGITDFQLESSPDKHTLSALDRMPTILASNIYNAYVGSIGATTIKHIEQTIDYMASYLGLIVLVALADRNATSEDVLPSQLRPTLEALRKHKLTVGRWLEIATNGSRKLVDRGEAAEFEHDHILNTIRSMFYDNSGKRHDDVSRSVEYRNQNTHKYYEFTSRRAEAEQAFNSLVTHLRELHRYPLVIRKPGPDKGDWTWHYLPQGRPRAPRGSFEKVPAKLAERLPQGDTPLIGILACDPSTKPKGEIPVIRLSPYIVADSKGGLFHCIGGFDDIQNGEFRTFLPEADKRDHASPLVDRSDELVKKLFSSPDSAKLQERLRALIESSERIIYAQQQTLVGRDSELSVCQDVLKRALDRDRSPPQVIAIIGQQGVGKTKLAHEALQLSYAKYFQTYEISCSINQMDIPFGRAVELVQELLKNRGEEAKDKPLQDAELLEEVAQFRGADEDNIRAADLVSRLSRLMIDLIAQQVNVPLIFVDDFVFADKASVRVLRDLIEHTRNRTLGGAIITTIQSDLLNTAPDVHSFLERLSAFSSDVYSKIELGPLDHSATSELCASMLGRTMVDVDVIADYTDGNPQQIVSFVRHLQRQEALRDLPSGQKAAVPESISEFRLPPEMIYLAREQDRRVQNLIRSALEETEADGRRIDEGMAQCRFLLSMLALADGILTPQDFVAMLILAEAYHDVSWSGSRNTYYALMKQLQAFQVIRLNQPPLTANGAGRVGFRRQIYRSYYWHEQNALAAQYYDLNIEENMARVVRGFVSNEIETTDYVHHMRLAQMYELVDDFDSAAQFYMNAAARLRERQLQQWGKRGDSGGNDYGQRLLDSFKPLKIRDRHLRFKYLIAQLNLFVDVSEAGKARIAAERLVELAETPQDRIHARARLALTKQFQGQIEEAMRDAEQAVENAEAYAEHIGGSPFQSDQEVRVDIGEAQYDTLVELSLMPRSVWVYCLFRATRVVDVLREHAPVNEFYETWVGQGKYRRLGQFRPDFCRSFMAAARAAHDLGLYQTAHGIFTRSHNLADRIDAREMQNALVKWEYQCRYARFLTDIDELEGSREILGRVLREIGGERDIEVRAIALGVLALTEYLSGDWEAALNHAESATDVYAKLDVKNNVRITDELRVIVEVMTARTFDAFFNNSLEADATEIAKWLQDGRKSADQAVTTVRAAESKSESDGGGWKSIKTRSRRNARLIRAVGFLQMAEKIVRDGKEGSIEEAMKVGEPALSRAEEIFRENGNLVDELDLMLDKLAFLRGTTSPNADDLRGRLDMRIREAGADAHWPRVVRRYKEICGAKPTLTKSTSRADELLTFEPPGSDDDLT